jgi:hypothetical protein
MQQYDNGNDSGNPKTHDFNKSVSGRPCLPWSNKIIERNGCCELFLGSCYRFKRDQCGEPDVQRDKAAWHLYLYSNRHRLKWLYEQCFGNHNGEPADYSLVFRNHHDLCWSVYALVS